MKKVLVLGASGAMGRYVVPELARMGYAVDAVSLDAPDPAQDPPGVSRIQGNAKEEAVLAPLLERRYDAIVDRYIMYPGDLVMSLTGTVGKDDYGNVCILGDDFKKYYLNQRNAKLEIREGLDKYYLSQLLRFDKIKKQLTGISRGVRQANISNRDILDLVVPIPPLSLQDQFAMFVHQIDKSKVAVQKSLNQAQLLFDSLMQQYFG